MAITNAAIATPTATLPHTTRACANGVARAETRAITALDSASDGSCCAIWRAASSMR